MLNDRGEEQKIIEVVQALILAPGRRCFPERILSQPLVHNRVISFAIWNGVLSDPQLQSAVDIPHLSCGSAPNRKGHGDDNDQI